jgi:hypothetical protein
MYFCYPLEQPRNSISTRSNILPEILILVPDGVI